jgi:hypothetical protein
MFFCSNDYRAWRQVIRNQFRGIDAWGSLKVVGNEKEGGSGRWQTIGIGLGPRRSMLFWLLVLLSSLF